MCVGSGNFAVEIGVKNKTAAAVEKITEPRLIYSDVLIKIIFWLSRLRKMGTTTLTDASSRSLF